ncbi:O-antigen ligase family protein [Candidatus Microgenomates bacterium]|nr:O-antigen ligase family protein [Candidatus Microgenomates bacterium]
MFLTYGLTVIIVGAWILKTINDKRLTFKRTPLDIPLLLFLGANIFSTILSIDTHISIWGYYSRQNGGLLSLIAYLLLYWAFVSNMDLKKSLNLLKAAFLSGFIISLYGILEHFGVSPSCVILRGEFNASCWVQDVQARVFATLGQPNWMAAYLAMLIFPALYFLLTSKSRILHTTYYILLIIMYLAFTFTYSRGPTLGLIGGLVVFIGLYFIQNTRKTQKDSESVYQRIRLSEFLISQIFRVLLSFLAINLLFGSALTNFRLVSKFAAPARPAIALPATNTTQLETGGTESGQIRFIVWQGALEIFKHYPLFGSGVETFAYSYYQFRPAEHNLTSEWDFLYNKAHNEYLNYLATTGILGLSAYSIIIITFIIFILKKFKKGNLLILSLLASYISYLIYNFFLFSVVTIAIFFYLFPAIAFVAIDSTKPLKFSRLLTSHFSLLTSYLYRRTFYTKIAKALVILSTIYLLFSIFQLWYADTRFAKGQRASELGNPGRAYNLLTEALQLNGNEPFYRSELSFAAAASAIALEDSEATLSAALKDEAIREIELVLKNSPQNVSFWRTAIRTYFELSGLDKNYTDKTLQALDQTIKLAPTDPKLYYNKALILQTINKTQEAIKSLEKAIELKPNYQEAIQQLEEATSSAKP